MKNNECKEIFFNRAEALEAENISCENCFEETVFLLKDKEHEFSMGLTTVLQCLEFAIKIGSLPKLPASWTSDVENAFDVQFDDDISYYDAEKFKERNPFK